MNYNPKNPVIVQSDRSILLETENPFYEEARDALAQFAELEKSPEHFHTYKVTPLSLWNAASSGLTADAIIDLLLKFSKYDVPQNIIQDIRDYVARYGRLRLYKREEDENLVLFSEDAALIAEIQRQKTVMPYIIQPIDKQSLLVKGDNRGLIKQALIKIGFPVEDLAGFTEGTEIPIELRAKSVRGKDFSLRKYQQTAVDIFCHVPADKGGGSGVFVLPCGAGKTVIAIGTVAAIGQSTLILCTNITALHQWRSELLDKTTLTEDMIGEYSGEVKEIKPVTLTTYQILTYRKGKEEAFLHMDIFHKENWGLIIYDEVHLLPAPVFRAVADIQAKRRLGLTATLVREDGKEDDVFSLIGPKKYDVPWKVLEKQGWIATAECIEIRVPLPEDKRMEYAVAELKAKFRIASENPAKMSIIRTLLQKHRKDNVLIIGQYLTQLNEIQRMIKAPIITGKTPNKERDEIYAKFKKGEIKVLIVSKVANFAIDLPDANVAIQISGTYGSRQEEAQRLGRVLRPKEDGNVAHFYSIISRDTKDQDFAANRQLFLTEQGYRYEIKLLDDSDASPEEALAAIS